MVYIKYRRINLDNNTVTYAETVFEDFNTATQEVLRWNNISKTWCYQIEEVRKATFEEQDNYFYPQIKEIQE